MTVKGAIDPLAGTVMDLAELDRLLDEAVVQRFHNRHINSADEAFTLFDATPTTENLAARILEIVRSRLPAGVAIQRVRVQEDRDLWSDVYGAESSA